MRRVQPYIVGTLFAVAGALHFAYPHAYETIVPPFMPAHRALVLISGACEMLGGVGVMLPRTRTLAGRGLIALLLAVFPANVYMALAPHRFSAFAPAWALYARLPLQFVAIAWVYAASVRGRRPEDGPLA